MGYKLPEFTGQVLVFDPKNDTVVKEVSGLTTPTSVAYYNDCNNTYYVVAESGNNRILVYNTDLQLIRTIGETGSGVNGTGDDKLTSSWAVIVGPNNNLWIADHNADRIVEFTIDGK